jgi:chemotaxis protein CheY-P-specific phosphatase CheC
MTPSNLFSTENELPNDKSLAITKSQTKPLSKEQVLFNKYSKKIELLRETIENNRLRYENLLTHHVKKLAPQQEAHANKLVDFVKVLYRYYKHEKLTNVAKEKLERLILNNLERAFEFIIPTEDAKVIYDALNGTSYDDEAKEQEEMMLNEMQEMLNKTFGVNMDFSDVDMNNPEDMARKMAEIEEQIKQQQKKENHTSQGRKKTKKQLANEVKQKEAEEIRNKSMRSIYTSLAKMLHPDVELDEQKKLEKEELMKKVTKAYQEKDLHTLLKMEIEIIYRESENLHHLTAQKLSVLILF